MFAGTPAYKGSEPYLFISYSHKDSKNVMADIEWMNRKGYRVWYDEGIEFGRDFPNELAKAIRNCTQFVVYLSPDADASEFVNYEINYSLKCQKRILPIYVAETILSDRLEFLLSSRQFLERYNHPWEEYCAYLETGLFQECRSAEPVGKSAQTGGLGGETDGGAAARPYKPVGQKEPLSSGKAAASGESEYGKAAYSPSEKKCPKCGRTNASSAAFCGYCGGNMSAPSPAPQPVRPPVKAAVYCGYCGGNVAEGSTFCGICGKSLKPLTNKPASFRPSQDEISCVCGRKVPANSRFCPYCGKSLIHIAGSGQPEHI